MKPLSRTACVGCLAAASLLAGMATAQTALPPPPDRRLTLDQVVRLSLQQSPGLQLSRQQTEGALGNAMEAAGGFDMLTEFSTNRTRSLTPLTPAESAQLAGAAINDFTNHASTQSNTRLSVQKTLRNGLILGSDYTVQRNSDALQALQPGPLGQAQSLGRLSFSIQVPLLRNTGRDVIGTAAEAARREAEASLASYEFDSSQTVLASTRLYWDLVAKQRLLALAVESESRTRRLLDEMRKLAVADQIPHADTELLSASSAEKAAYRVAAEQALLAARRSLARQLGLSAADELGLGQPATPFPVPDQRALLAASNVSAAIDAAMPRRADLRAAGLRQQAAQLQRVAAEHNLRPVANLSASISEGGLALGKSTTALDSPFFTDRTGPTFSVGLQMQWPLQNQQARGQLLARSASAVAAEIQRRDLQAAIGSGVGLAASALSASVVQLQAAAQAARHYEKSVANEHTRRRLGAGTVIDILTIEDRLSNVQQTEVLLRQTYANALAQRAFETAELIQQRSSNEFEVRLDSLLHYAAGSTGTGER